MLAVTEATVKANFSVTGFWTIGFAFSPAGLRTPFQMRRSIASHCCGLTAISTNLQFRHSRPFIHACQLAVFCIIDDYHAIDRLSPRRNGLPSPITDIYNDIVEIDGTGIFWRKQ